MLALIHLDQAEYEAALESAEQALAINPTDDVSHYVMGKALLATGQEEQAITEMETFLNLTWDRARIRDFREEVEALLEADGT
ncbi:MAG: tetratricopeptide repeat protein [Chloroflexota bacterium]